jgi:hypothetical protein
MSQEGREIMSTLPKPPFIYRNADAMLFLPDDLRRPVRFWGAFPNAPTGPFAEVWTMRPLAGDRYEVDRIIVNNLCRLTAGRRIWGMPKEPGTVDISSSRRGMGARVLQDGQEWIASITWPEAAMKAYVFRPFALNLDLPQGIETSLTFESAAKVLRARYSGPDGIDFGRGLRLGGTAVLSEPQYGGAIAA